MVNRYKIYYLMKKEAYSNYQSELFFACQIDKSIIENLKIKVLRIPINT